MEDHHQEECASKGINVFVHVYFCLLFGNWLVGHIETKRKSQLSM